MSSINYKIPLRLAIVMNVNAMIGAGLFGNISTLTLLANSWGPFSYLFVALLIAPLVLTISTLARLFPAVSGGLYSYIKAGLGERIGFISLVCYFVAKSSSCAILLNIAYSYFCNTNILHSINPELFKIIITLMLIFFTRYGIKLGSQVQIAFMMLKMIPIFFIIIIGYSLMPSLPIPSFAHFPSSFSSTLPIALYALMGFETCCAMGHLIEGGSRILSKIILFSFMLVAIIAAAFQGSLFGLLGTSLASSTTPIYDFFHYIHISSISSDGLSMFINSFIVCSVLGACYGIIYANMWNGYTAIMALPNLQKVSFLKNKNNYGIPIYALIMQGIIIVFGILFFNSILTLVRLTVSGIAVCYVFATLSLLKLYKTNKNIPLPLIIPCISLLSSCFIIFAALRDLL